MGRLFVIDLEGDKFTCKHCQTHLALFDDFIAKSFCYGCGNAYLFAKVVNVTFGDKEERPIRNWIHTMADVFCVGCGSNVGCKIEAAKDERQTFEVGKFVLKRFQVLGPCGSSNSIKLGADMVSYRRQGTGIRRSNALDQLLRERDEISPVELQLSSNLRPYSS